MAFCFSSKSKLTRVGREDLLTAVAFSFVEEAVYNETPKHGGSIRLLMTRHLATDVRLE